MIEEPIIEGVAASLTAESLEVDQLVGDTMDAAPGVVAFLSQDSVRLLTDDEYAMLWYIVTVILRSWQQVHGSLPDLTVESLGDQEEQLWTWYDQDAKLPFSQRLDRFFDATKEEDLLAFVEDMTVLDDDHIITEAGRPIIVVMASAIVLSLDI